MKVVFLLVALLAMSVSGRTTDQWEADYVTVRPGAHMFYWLYRCQNASAPLVMWLQGGPGASGTGYGNFLEIGPVDTSLNPRNSTWLQKAHLLFVDNPVGTGFSYVESPSLLTRSEDDIAADLLTLFSAFMNSHPELVQNPFYIFAESYGGKMTTSFANVLWAAIHSNSIQSNFKGVALGDSWVSPMDFVASWGPYLASLSLVDSVQLDKLNQGVSQIQDAINKQQWEQATSLWSALEDTIEQVTDNVDFYNVLLHNVPDDAATTLASPHLKKGLYGAKRMLLQKYQAPSLAEFMNGYVRNELGIIPSNVTWGGQSDQVFSALSGDFMRDVIAGVDLLLSRNVSVTVYNGQLDLICATPGTEAWVSKLKWSGLPAFQAASKQALYAPVGNTNTAGFVKSHANFAFYFIMKAGHMVPSDAPDMALQMLSLITGSH